MTQKRIDMAFFIVGVVMILNGVCLILREPLTPDAVVPQPEPEPEPEQAEVIYHVQWNSNILYATNMYANEFVTNLFFSATNIIVKSSERIVQELIDNGFTPEDAIEAYRIISGMAAEKREHTSIDSPGTRISKPNRLRFPAFEEQ